MKYPDVIQAETQQENALMQALYEQRFNEDFVKEMERLLNEIGMNTEMSQGKKVALAGYIFIKMCDAVGLDDVRPELLLKALDDASRFDKILKTEERKPGEGE